MAYNDTPLANQRISDTQPLIRSNFSQIQTAFSVEHVAIASPTQGLHKKVTFPVQGASPVVTLGNIALFNKLPIIKPLTGENELFITRSDGVSFPMTAGTDIGNSGFAYFPSGILMKWGFVSITANPNPKTVDFVVDDAIPVFNNCYNIQFTYVNTSTDVDANKSLTVCGLTATNFRVRKTERITTNDATAVNFYYLAIGN